MWICLSNAFVSIVKDWQQPGNLLVRARKKEHLERLFPASTKILGGVVETPARDYRWRLSVPKDTVSEVIAMEIRHIDYGNFKNSVKEKGLHDLYARFWNDHYDYQSAKGL